MLSTRQPSDLDDDAKLDAELEELFNKTSFLFDRGGSFSGAKLSKSEATFADVEDDFELTVDLDELLREDSRQGSKKPIAKKSMEDTWYEQEYAHPIDEASAFKFESGMVETGEPVTKGIAAKLNTLIYKERQLQKLLSTWLQNIGCENL
jgi:hypothetical protein